MEENGSLAEHRFRRLFDTNARVLLAYALRRTTSPADAADVVAETMLIAWRRLDDVPAGEEARLWLFGVARRVVANHDRGVLRRDRLASRLGEHLEQAVERSRDESVVVAMVLAEAMQALDQSDRELLQLTAWEGLSPTEIAVVLDIPAATVRSRLRRAARNFGRF